MSDTLCHENGYWLGGRPSAAVPRESARIRADSARFRADPPDVRQKYFSADSAERPADSGGVRADTSGSARTPRRTGGRVHSKNVRRQKPPLHQGSPRKNLRCGRPSAAEIIVRTGLGLGLGLWYSNPNHNLNPNPNPNHNPNLNPNPNFNPKPDPTSISAAEGHPLRKFFREEQWCKISFCLRTFFE